MGAESSRLLAEVKANRCREVKLDADVKPAELLQMIEALRSNTSVEELILAENSKIATPAVARALVAMLAANRSITRLQLRDIRNPDFPRAFSQGMLQHTMLEDFSMWNCTLNGVGFQAIAGTLLCCSNLRQLHLEGLPVEVAEGAALDALCALLQCRTKLQRLTLITAAPPSRWLAALAKTSSLRELNLFGYLLDVSCASALGDMLRSHSALEDLALSFDSDALRLALDPLIQHPTLRLLWVKASAEDAKHIPALLFATTRLTTLELRFPPLAEGTIDAIVDALQSNFTIIAFKLPDQKLTPAQMLAIDQVLRRNKKAAARAASATNSNGGSPALVSSADDDEALADTPSPAAPYTAAASSPVQPAAAAAAAFPSVAQWAPATGSWTHSVEVPMAELVSPSAPFLPAAFPASPPPSVPGANVSALLERMAQLEAREAEREAKLAQMEADGLSQQAEREADQRTIHRLREHVDTLTAQLARLRQRAEGERARGGGDGWDERSAVADERRSQQELGALKVQLMQQKARQQEIGGLEEPD